MGEPRKSSCRFCHVFCGIEVDIEDGRATALRGDRDTGVHHNLATQLVMTLDALCVRYDRPGGMNRNEGAFGPTFGPDNVPIQMPEPPKSRIRGISAVFLGSTSRRPPIRWATFVLAFRLGSVAQGLPFLRDLAIP